MGVGRPLLVHLGSVSETTTTIPGGPPPTQPATQPGIVHLDPASRVVPGSHQDGADLWGILVALLVMAVAVVAVRVLFRRGGDQVTRQR